jgi:hypothetical protein
MVKQKKKEYLQCLTCEKDKNKQTDFYNTHNKLYKNIGKIPICKDCLFSRVDYLNMETVYEILRQFDIKFDIEYWEKAEESKYETFKRYMTMANSLPQFVGTGWKNSVFEKKLVSSIHDFDNESNITEEIFKPTVELIKKWGKFEPEDYFKLEDFYTKMMISNKIETPQEETYLMKLAVISLKMDKELEAGNYGQVKQLGDLFSKYMADSKFRAMDQTDASKTGGLRTFSQIYAEVEKDEFIPPWEEYRKIKGLEQDIVDKTIMHILNYTLKLNKAPQLIIPPEDTPKIEED